MAHQNGAQIEQRLNGNLLALTKVYRITRTDGTVLRFTDHDRKVYFDEYFFEPDLSKTLITSGVVDFQASGGEINIDATSSTGQYQFMPVLGATVTISGAHADNNGDHEITYVHPTGHRIFVGGSTITTDLNKSGVTIVMKAKQGLNEKIFTPQNAWDSTNVRYESGMKKASIDFQGAVSSDQITDDDVRAGLYVNAVVDIAWIDWKMPHLGAIRVNRFKLDTFEYDDNKWVAQANNKMADLYVKAGKVFGTTCWHSFTGSACGIAKVHGTTFMRGRVTAVTSQTEIRWKATDVSTYGVTEADEYFSNGHLEFVQDAGNNGTVLPIKKSLQRTGSDASITSDDARLFFPYPLRTDIAVDDYFIIYAGCDKTTASCASTTLAGKTNNILNFGGFPKMPTTSVLVNENENEL